MTGYLEVTLGGFLGSSIAATVLRALFLRRNKTVESEIKLHFDLCMANCYSSSHGQLE